MSVNLRGAFVSLRECAWVMTGGGAILSRSRASRVSSLIAPWRITLHSKAGLAELVRSAAC